MAMSARRKVPLEAWSHGAEMVEILNLADLDLIMNAQLGVARHWQDHHIWSPPLGVQQLGFTAGCMCHLPSCV